MCFPAWVLHIHLSVFILLTSLPAMQRRTAIPAAYTRHTSRACHGDAQLSRAELLYSLCSMPATLQKLQAGYCR